MARVPVPGPLWFTRPLWCPTPCRVGVQPRNWLHSPQLLFVLRPPISHQHIGFDLGRQRGQPASLPHSLFSSPEGGRFPLSRPESPCPGWILLLILLPGFCPRTAGPGSCNRTPNGTKRELSLPDLQMEFPGMRVTRSFYCWNVQTLDKIIPRGGSCLFDYVSFGLTHINDNTRAPNAQNFANFGIL